jgi:hypothetical protein
MGPKYCLSFFWDWVLRLFTVQILPSNKPRGMLKVFQCFDRYCHIQGCCLWRGSVIGSPRNRLNYISFRCSRWKRHGKIIYLTDQENELLKNTSRSLKDFPTFYGNWSNNQSVHSPVRWRIVYSSIHSPKRLVNRNLDLSYQFRKSATLLPVTNLAWCGFQIPPANTRTFSSNRSWQTPLKSFPTNYLQSHSTALLFDAI